MEHFAGLDVSVNETSICIVDDAGGTLSPGACEDVTQPETADAADPSQAAAVESHRH